MGESTVFAKIIRGELPAEKVFENEHVIAIHDLYPIAPVHLLIIPKKAIASLQEVQEEDLPLLAECLRIAKMLASEFKIEKGYRLLTNSGTSAGQTIFHLHFHLIGGRPLGTMG